MAQMPRGEPRSVPDPAGEQYDEMVRRQKAGTGPRKSPPTPATRPFSPFEHLDAVRQEPRRDSTVTIGDRTYREVDNGRANVLVEAPDPLFTPAERAAQRQGIERAFYMAGHPIGTVAYGAATLANAPPRVRDGVLLAGGLADDTMSGAVSRVGPIRRSATPPKAQHAPPPFARPNIRLREYNSDRQALGMTATVTSPMLRSGTRAARNLTPPGWQGHGTRYNEARGHLLAALLGGAGDDMRNLVTLTQRGANSPLMQNFERAVARRVRSGEVVEYSATPLYNKGVLPPSAILLTAQGSRGRPTARIIENPAGRRR